MAVPVTVISVTVFYFEMHRDSEPLKQEYNIQVVWRGKMIYVK